MTLDADDVWPTRILEVYENGQPVRELTAVVSRPKPVPQNPWLWECQFLLEGFEDIGPLTVYEGDAIGAAQLAIDVLGAHLHQLAKSHDIRLFGSRDLRFRTPIIQGEPQANAQ